LKKPEHRIMRKGQIFSADLMLAGIVFLFILSLTIVYSNETANRVALAEKGNARDLAAITTGQALVYSRGTMNWALKNSSAFPI